MKKEPVLPLNKMRLINLATYTTVVIIGVLGIGGLANLWPRLVFAGLCLAFALVYAVAVRSKDFARRAPGYFALQTLLFMGLLIVHTPSGAVTFLLFILAIHATTVFAGRIAAGWVGLFYLLASLNDFLTYDVENAIGSALFNIALFFLAGMIGHNTRQTELARRANQRLVEELQAAHNQLHDLAVAEERNRLAREIHDGLGHYLTATTIQIQGARALLAKTGAAGQPSAALDALGKAEILLQEALADVRRSVAALRAAPIKNKPLPTAISELAAECQAISGLEVQFNLLGAPRALNSQVELTLYRVAQEGLTNVRKHAQATRVTVALVYDDGRVGLSISDDGQGMGETSTGYGLLGLRERVQLVGGAVNIHTAPSQGCRIDVEIPL